MPTLSPIRHGLLRTGVSLEHLFSCDTEEQAVYKDGRTYFSRVDSTVSATVNKQKHVFGTGNSSPRTWQTGLVGQRKGTQKTSIWPTYSGKNGFQHPCIGKNAYPIYFSTLYGERQCQMEVSLDTNTGQKVDVPSVLSALYAYRRCRLEESLATVQEICMSHSFSCTVCRTCISTRTTSAYNAVKRNW